MCKLSCKDRDEKAILLKNPLRFGKGFCFSCHLILWRDIQVFKSEAVHIRPFVNLFGGGFAGSVPSLLINADKDWIIAFLIFLQGSRKLEGVSRHNTIVMIAGGNHCSWVRHRFYIM